MNTIAKTLVPLAAFALLATPTWAKHWDANPELESSILNVHADHWPHRDGDSHMARAGDGTVYELDLRQGHYPHAAGDSHMATPVSDSQFGPGPGRR